MEDMTDWADDTSAIPGRPIVLDAAQRTALAAIVDGSAPVLVTGGPGSGKTEVLVRAVTALVEAGEALERLVVWGSTRPAAQRLRRRIVGGLRGAHLEPRITTVHGWCYAWLAKTSPHGVVPRILTAPEQEFRVRELVDAMGPGLWPEDLRAASRTAAFAGHLRGLLTRARQLGFDPSDLVAAGRAAGRPPWCAAGTFFAAYLDVLDAEHVLDYTELVHRTRVGLVEPGVAEVLRSQTRLVLVDELAECDAAQWGLLHDIQACGVPVAGFADASTSIFGFRGAAPRPEALFAELLQGTTGVVVDLPGNHRNAPRVAQACAALESCLHAAARRPAADASRAAGPSDPGSVEGWICASASVRESHLGARLWVAHQGDRVPWGQMAVLGPADDAGLVDIARGLSGQGIPVRFEAVDVGLAQSGAVRQFLPVLDLVAAWAEQRIPADGVIEAALDSRLSALDTLAIRRLARALPDQGGTPLAAVARVFAAGAPTGEPEPTAEPLWHCHRRWSTLAQGLAGGAGVSDVLWQVWSGSPWPEEARAEALAGGPAAAAANTDLDAVVALFDLAGAHPGWRGPAGLRRFRALVDQYVIGADTARESDPRDRAVLVTSVRRAKGRGWPVVVVVGAVEGRWPVHRRGADLFETGALVAPGEPAPAEPAMVADLLREQQRAFLAACSRAERCLIVVAEPDQPGDPVRWSRFARQAGVTPVCLEGPASSSVTVEGLVARLRRAGLDAEASPASREVAVSLLAWLAGQTTATGHRLASGADPGTWWGVPLEHSDRRHHPAEGPVTPETELVLAGGEVGGLLACPRWWFLTHRARGSTPPGWQAGFGSLLHRVFQLDADGTFGADRVGALLDAAWGALPFTAPWQAEAQRDRAQVLYERFCRWRDSRPERTLVAVEVPARWRTVCDGRPVTVTGVIDRLERDGAGRAVIIDFKTGARPALADHRDQLALYELAVTHGACGDSASGPDAPHVVGSAELVCPAAASPTSDRPKVLVAPSLTAVPHDAAMEFDSPAYPTWAQARLAQASRIVRAGRFDARPGPMCRNCPVRSGCPAHGSGEEG